MSDDRPDENLLHDASELILVSANLTSGDPQEDALRFAYADGVVYLLAEPGAGWHRNVEKDRGVVVRIRRRGFRGRARLFDARQHAAMAGQVAERFRRKYGRAAIADQDLAGLQPVTIDLQF
jgi:hypothetical protein